MFLISSVQEKAFKKKRNYLRGKLRIFHVSSRRMIALSTSIFSSRIFKYQIIALRAACMIRDKKVIICDKHSGEAKYIRCMHSKYFTSGISILQWNVRVVAGRETLRLNVEAKHKRVALTRKFIIARLKSHPFTIAKFTAPY